MTSVEVTGPVKLLTVMLVCACVEGMKAKPVRKTKLKTRLWKERFVEALRIRNFSWIKCEPKRMDWYRN